VICAVLYLQPWCYPYTVYKLNSFLHKLLVSLGICLPIQAPSRKLNIETSNILSVSTLMAASCILCFSISASEAFLISRWDSSSATLTFSASKSADSSDRTWPIKHLRHSSSSLFQDYYILHYKKPSIFCLELCQFSTNFDNFWHKDGQGDDIM